MDELTTAEMVRFFRFMHRRVDWPDMDHLVGRVAERCEALHELPVQMQDGRTLYLDLRNPVAIPYLLEGEFPCERWETAFARCIVQPGDTVIDIGANVGWYSSLLSECVGPDGRVVAFEPNPELVRLLQQLAREHPQLEVVDAGVADRDGEADFQVTPNWISGTFGQVDDAIATHRTKLVTLDHFLADRQLTPPTFIKCDAEGVELQVLAGARALLASEWAPIWMVEFSSEEAEKCGQHPARIAEVFENVADQRYQSYIINQQDGTLDPLAIPSAGPFWFNVIFTPPHLGGRLDLWRDHLATADGEDVVLIEE
ncbi:MAG: FkbM family methyltransferase [Phycisphaeraceae bacterium]